MNILIADDEKQMVKNLSAYFQKEGFNTITAVDGEEALDLFHLHKIDLAILVTIRTYKKIIKGYR